jgi:hypothetical protein
MKGNWVHTGICMGERHEGDKRPRDRTKPEAEVEKIRSLEVSQPRLRLGLTRARAHTRNSNLVYPFPTSNEALGSWLVLQRLCHCVFFWPIWTPEPAVGVRAREVGPTKTTFSFSTLPHLKCLCCLCVLTGRLNVRVL